MLVRAKGRSPYSGRYCPSKGSTDAGGVPRGQTGCVVNDVHSRLNCTSVAKVVEVAGVDDVTGVLGEAARCGRKVCVAGGRHSMGGQQFLTDATLIDTGAMNRVLDFNQEQGTIRVEAGINWPRLIEWLKANQSTSRNPWTIVQKQTGCDDLVIGGAVSSNVHGRGLRLCPLVGDIEEIELIPAPPGHLSPVKCSRSENSELFRLAVGGYGMFGVLYSVKLRLVPRRLLRRDVVLTTTECLMPALDQAMAQGATYGDFQFAIDSTDAGFLRTGILSTYTPVEYDTSASIPERKLLSEQDWRDLLYLAHVDKSRAFQRYLHHYMATDGQLYWSDTFQLSTYINGYHSEVEHRAGLSRSSEIITELYVPRAELPNLLAQVADCFRRESADVIYGTVRLIEQDRQTFLPWATDRFACIVFNLHTAHDEESLRRTRAVLVQAIDIAIALGGSYYLTYHRFARKDQLLACYPQFPEFLDLKCTYDPLEILQSAWYRHHKEMFSQGLTDVTGYC